jgi:hypothetical protein
MLTDYVGNLSSEKLYLLEKAPKIALQFDGEYENRTRRMQLTGRGCGEPVKLLGCFSFFFARS